MSEPHKMYDVIVVGGGISGAMAAIGAARAGAKTLVVEQYGFLGGMLTAAGVGPMMTFHAGDEQVIQGTTGELIDRLEKKGRSPGHIYDTTGFTYTVTPFDVEGMKMELELMLTEAGGELLYHAMLASVQTDGNKISAITICTKAGLSQLRAKVFIDATGDADLAMHAGVKCTKGRESDGACQPMTMKMRMMNVDIQEVRDYIKNNPDEFPRLEGDVNKIDKASRISIGGFVKSLAKGREAGDFTFPREDILFFEANTRGEVIVNTTRILGYDANDPWSLSLAEMEGRKQALEVDRFLKKYIPGFGNSVLVYTGPQIGVRSSRQIKGRYTLTGQDVVERKSFPDTIAHTGYPIDIHSPDGEGTDHVKPEWGTFCNIPYRCLVNDQISNMITVGRCISVDFEAQAGIRTTPTMGAVGQAGGIAAAIAVQDGAAVGDVDVGKLQEILLKQGGFLCLKNFQPLE
ncbi:FAD-dependent oxidoreductase [Pontiellaceae bacterium B1224]|nr:FAD-dependent oxidoreductase [Pontiellaceae bacterium B1224]